jgi:hypothetical protein
MKKIILYFSLILALQFISCDASIENQIVFKNDAATDITVNFRATLIEVPSGGTVTLKEIPVGTYSYASIIAVPSGVTEVKTEGDVSGEFVLNPGTRILVYYTSMLTATTYTVFASVSSNEDLNPDDNPFSP